MSEFASRTGTFKSDRDRTAKTPITSILRLRLRFAHAAWHLVSARPARNVNFRQLITFVPEWNRHVDQDRESWPDLVADRRSRFRRAGRQARRVHAASNDRCGLLSAGSLGGADRAGPL